MSVPRNTALDAVDVLNDLIGDITTGCSVLLSADSQFRRHRLSLRDMSGIQKMCMSHLVLALSKLLEFWERYHAAVPPAHANQMRLLLRRVRAKNVEPFRNSVAGHIWDNALGRCLRHSEIMDHLTNIVGDIPAFDAWLRNPADPSAVSNILTVVRNAIMEEHTIAPNEVINR